MNYAPNPIFGHPFSFQASKMKQLHGNSSRFVRELTPEEKADISKRVKSTDRNIRDRSKVIELSSAGFSIPQIMEELRRCRNYVLGWIDRFNNKKNKIKLNYRLYVILDCWSAHTTSKLKEKLNEHAITLLFLPTNASWLNDVERVFSDVERNILANSDEPDSEHLQNRITNYLHAEYPKKI